MISKPLFLVKPYIYINLNRLHSFSPNFFRIWTPDCLGFRASRTKNLKWDWSIQQQPAAPIFFSKSTHRFLFLSGKSILSWRNGKKISSLTWVVVHTGTYVEFDSRKFRRQLGILKHWEARSKHKQTLDSNSEKVQWANLSVFTS